MHVIKSIFGDDKQASKPLKKPHISGTPSPPPRPHWSANGVWINIIACLYEIPFVLLLSSKYVFNIYSFLIHVWFLTYRLVKMLCFVNNVYVFWRKKTHLQNKDWACLYCMAYWYVFIILTVRNHYIANDVTVLAHVDIINR